MTTFRLDDDLLARLDRWIAAQPAPPSKSAVLTAALRAWLDASEINPTPRKKRKPETCR